jgi:hypothetical protein
MRRTVMRRILGSSALVLALMGTALSQEAFHQSDKLVSAGLGLGMYGLYGSSTLPPIFVMYEMGVAPKISVGGIVAYSGSSQDFADGTWKYSYVVIAARGSYHFLEHQKNFDAYAGAGLGYGIVSASTTWRDPQAQHFGVSAGGSYLFFDIHVGGRYFFSPKWSALAELGYGVGFLRVGVTYKL